MKFIAFFFGCLLQLVALPNLFKTLTHSCDNARVMKINIVMNRFLMFADDTQSRQYRSLSSILHILFRVCYC
jgi:hypothetical protein